MRASTPVGSDLSEVVDPTAERLAPVSPGEVLRAELLEPLQLGAGAVASAIGVPRNCLLTAILNAVRYEALPQLGVPRNRLTAILNSKRAITADTARRGARRPGLDRGPSRVAP